MTLVITALAAVIFTVLWYKGAPENKMRFDIPCWIYWGATLMWLVDAIFEFAELKADYFAQSVEKILNDICLGLTAVLIGMIVWILVLIFKDPRGIMKAVLFKKK